MSIPKIKKCLLIARNCEGHPEIRLSSNEKIEEINSNFVTSVYGRNHFADFFRRMIEKDCVRYVSKEKSQGMLERWGEQYSELTNTLDFEIIIHQSRKMVKGNFTKTFGRTKTIMN